VTWLCLLSFRFSRPESLQGSKKSIRLQVVSSYAQFVNSSDKIACQKAPILGLIKTISQEMPWLICRHVDLQSDRPEVNAALLLNEMRALKDGEVAYRNGQRLVSRLEKADLSVEEKQPLPFKKEGMYLVTGGLGGIGLEIAKYILKNYQARLLLVGRTVLPPRNTWKSQLQNSDAIADRIQAYLSLEQLGGEINYEAVDICDRDALQQVVERAKSNWGSELDGIIHLAGIFQERLLLEETQESIAAVLRPKLSGTWVLHQLLGDRGIFIHFSSVNGFFGGTGVGAYAAANSFIDRFAKYQKYQTSLQSYCFAWSMWDDTGMSRGYQHKDLTKIRGFSLVNPTQGLNSFLAGLHHNQAQLLIGLDGSNFNLRKHLKTQSYHLQKLTAYFTQSKQAKPSDNNAASITETKLTLRDRFGTKSDCDLVKLEEMPLTETGAIDRELLALNSVAQSSDRTQPRTEIERKIAIIWQEVLKVPQVSIHDNFFELGGHSLLATQVISRVRAAFSVELPLSCLFASPTVEGLSKQVDLKLKVGSIEPVEKGLLIPSKRHLAKDSSLVTQTRETVQSLEPLSFAQQRLWFLDRLEGASSVYNVPAALRLKGSLNVPAIEEALQKIGQRHEVLRTRFPMVEGTPVQAIDSNFVLSLTIIDLPQLSEPESAIVQRLVTEEAQTPFDLEKDFLLRAKLLRLSDREHILLLTLHHIVADGWSLGILVQELSVLYEAIISEKTANLPPLPIQYADFAAWQRQYLQADVLDTQLNYWQQQLQGIPPLLALPSDRPRPPVQTLRGRSFGFTLSQKLTKKLMALSQQSNATLFMTLLAAFGILLSRYSRQEDLVIGTAIANRHRQELESLIGFFVNTLALRLDLKDSPSFREFLERVRQVTLDAYAHQDLPFERLVEEIQPERNLSHSPLFQVTFALQNAPLGELKLSGLTWNLLETENVTAKFDLSLAMRETESGIEGVWEYNCDLFEASTIERMMGHFQVLLEGIVINPDESITNLPLLTQKEHQQLLEWNATQVDYPQQCIHQLFESQVEKTPDAVAIAFEKQYLTYRELNARANQLAYFLQKLGVEPEMLVGLCVERSLEAIVGMLGILKAGGTYVPLDPTYPTERLAYLLKDAGVKVLLTQQRLVNLLPLHQAQLVRLDTDWEIIDRENCNNINTLVKPDNLAYIIYTSGSTGTPKGVLLAHQGLCNLATAQIKLFKVNSYSRVLQFASLSFDASVWEIVMALCSGARLYLGRQDSLLPGTALQQFLQEKEITHVTLPPTALAVLPTEELPALQTIIVAGEACSAELAKRWSSDRRFFNAYGPTEATVCATIAEYSDRTKPSIGRPLPNTQVYILDRHLQPVPVGVPGELHIGGVGLAKGYLNQPELTEAKFIFAPFNRSKLYKTGDLARYLPDGNIEYLDRIDNQVKIRGFRIELGEIEAVLAKNPHVREAIALVSEQLGHKRIIAYVVPHFNTLSDRSQSLRNYLKQHLPEYMMPSTFVTLDSLPLTPNGKVDRRALAALNPLEEECVASVPPRTATEKLLSEIWAEVLGLEQVGINRNFFELGGDSILSIQIVAKASQAGLQLTPKQIFQYQTIAELASVVGTTEFIFIKQDLVTGSVPLTPIQHWFFEQNLPELHHFNQAVLLEVESDLKPELLSSAIASLLQHHDALRLQFVSTKESWLQINAAPDATVPLQIEDLSNLSAQEQQATIEATATQIQTSLALSSGLIQVVLFHLGKNKPGRLLIVIHHLAVDGVSWRILLEDLSRAYQQLASDRAIQLPPKTTSFQEWARRLQAYGRSPTLAAELNYWLAQSRSEKVNLPVDYPEGKENNIVADAAVITVSLGEEETRALLQEVPSAYNTQINDVLLTALLQSFAQWTKENSLLVDLEGHGREELEEDLDLSRTVGWFTSIYPMRLQKEERSHLGEALKSVKEQLRRVPKRGIGYGIGRYLSDRQTQASLEALPSAEVSFNYLGQFEQMLTASPFLGVAPESTGKPRSSLQKRKHLLEINSIVVAGKLQISWTYSEKVHRKATIERLAESFLEALQALIAHCQSPSAGGYTPSDFAAARLNQKQLDRFMTKLKKIDED
jgi:amino acid adenylation domain-containing protein/non-ribosomal peptide synthase protein (TIGR01720 family)